MSNYPLTLFYDGGCAICRFDIANLSAANREGLLQFVDITAPGFDPGVHGRTLEDFHARMHAQKPDGSFVTGLEVFRLATRAVGAGWIAAPSGWRLLKGPMDRVYDLFARHRTGLSARFGFIFDTLLAWQASRRASACGRGSCSLPTQD